MDGVLNVRKATGPTSHDVVDQVRRIFGQKRVGHAGTLDPLASGVLVVCLGKATRVVEYLMGLPKEYRARMVLGASTDTQDSTGAVIGEHDASGITREALEKAAEAFVGQIEQIPPMTSALKHEGQPLYKLARAGRTVERMPRKITVHSIDITDFGPVPDSRFPIPNSAELLVRCSSGTYIRTLCSDIGDRLGCGAHMSALQRTRVGRFSVEEGASVEEIESARREGRLDGLVMSIDQALADLPSVTVAEEDAARAANGMVVACSDSGVAGSTVLIHSSDGALIAIGEVSAGPAGCVVKPRKVLAPGPDSQLSAPEVLP